MIIEDQDQDHLIKHSCNSKTSLVIDDELQSIILATSSSNKIILKHKGVYSRAYIQAENTYMTAESFTICGYYNQV